MKHIATKSRAGLMGPAHVKKLDGIEDGANVTNATTVGSTIHGSSAKATPVDADTVALIDSAASNTLKKVSWSNIKSTLKAYFDTLYAAVGHSHSNATTSAAGFMSATDKQKLDGIAAGASVTNATTVGSAIHGSSAKTTPVDADTVALIDSAASNTLKKLSWSNIKSTLKAYFDTLYSAASHTHAAATTSAAGFMSPSDKSKLDGIQAQATKNDTDANLKNRANHTGTQPISTISGLQGALDSKLDLAGGTMTGRLEIPAASADGAMLNVGQSAEGPSSPVTGDVWISGNVLYFRGTSSTRALGSTGNLSTVSQAEAEAGTATSTRAWTAQRVRQAVAAYAAPISHGHEIADVNGLQAALDGKAASLHTHGIADVSGLQAALDAKLDASAASTDADADTIVKRTSDGDINGRYIKGDSMWCSHSASTRSSDTIFYSSTDNYIRKNTAAGFKASLGITISDVANLQSSLNAKINKTGDTDLGGFVSTTYNLGNSSGRTIKPNPADGNYQTLTNNGNFTLQAPDDINWSSFSILIRISGSGGTCTATGFTKVYGQLRPSGNNFATIRVINTTKVLVFEEAS